MFDITYAISQCKERGHYRVAKFGHRKEPDKVYLVFLNTAGIGTCSCPARKGDDDKHVLMVKRWIKAGQPLPAVVDEDGNYLYQLEGANGH